MDFALGRLSEGWKPREIMAVLRAMPEAPSRRYGLAARIAARDALGPPPPPSGGGTAAQILAAYNKAFGDR